MDVVMNKLFIMSTLQSRKRDLTVVELSLADLDQANGCKKTAFTLGARVLALLRRRDF